jgi:hypothetical protein
VVPQVEQPTPREEYILALAKVCHHEASRSQRDCFGINQVAHAIRGCVNAEGHYVRCSKPHVRRELPIEALRRHSGRVLGVRETDKRRTLLIRDFRLDASRPAAFTEEEWEDLRPHWENSIAWATEAVDRNPRVCSPTPITWGGSMDTRHPKARGLVHVPCGTSNRFYANP